MSSHRHGFQWISSIDWGAICSLSAAGSYMASRVEALIREGSCRLVTMIKHLPLALSRGFNKGCASSLTFAKAAMILSYYEKY